ncbi:MAG: fumarylacetoacetate hydrolase family protein [Phycisphaerales bacterium]|nr:fumarylacetoacetate hydrolase family protein [Phycisphaerales bacterium]
MTRTVPPAILCIGRNYADHASEMGGQLPERPMVFMKNPASAAGPADDIVIPEVCAQGGPQVDFEGELAVIIGRDCINVPASDALSVVGGYAVANDVSARWWQNHGSGGQFCRGKSFDTFCPMSVPAAAATVGDPQSLRIVTTLNGEVMQDSSTAHMIFPVAALIADLSRGMTLLAGTVILTGTPSGVGHARKPPRYLADGDVVSVTVERVGSIRNRVVERR